MFPDAQSTLTKGTLTHSTMALGDKGDPEVDAPEAVQKHPLHAGAVRHPREVEMDEDEAGGSAMDVLGAPHWPGRRESRGPPELGSSMVASARVPRRGPTAA